MMLSQFFVSFVHTRSQRNYQHQTKCASTSTSHQEGMPPRSCAGSRSRRRGTRLLLPHVNDEHHKSCPNKRLQSSDLTTAVDNNRGETNSTMDNYNHNNRLLQPQNSPSSQPSSAASSPACSPCQNQPLNHAHHDHRTAAPRNLPPSSRTATPRRVWSSITSAVFASLVFLLVFELFSHQFLSAYSVHAQDVAPRRISGSANSNNYYSLINLTNNKVFHHNRSIATIPTTTVRTGSTSGKAKVRPSKLKAAKGSKAKGSGKSRPKPEKSKPNHYKERGNDKEDETNAVPSSLRPRDPNNKPLYMKQTPPPVADANADGTFYLSTSKIPNSTPLADPAPTGPSNAASIRFRRPPRPFSLWNPSAPDISSSDSDNSMSYWKGSNKLPLFGHYIFSTTTSRSMSSRLPPPPSYQYMLQPQNQLDPLSILKTEMQSTTGNSKEDVESEIGGGKGRSDMDKDHDDKDEDVNDSVGRSNIEILKNRSPIYERPKTTAMTFNVTTVSSGVTSGKKLTSNFFENFEDHWDDPIADETRAPQEVIATVPAPTGPSGGDSSQQIHSTASSPSAPPPTSPSQEATGSGDTGTGPDPNLKNHRYSPPQDYGTGPSSPEHGYLNPPTLQNYPLHYHSPPGSLYKHPKSKHSYFSTHKTANYWPQKLNSYYGESVSAQVAHEHMLAHSPPLPPPRPPPLPPPPPHLVNRHRQRARFPPAGAYPVPAHPYQHHLLQPPSGPPQISHVLNPNIPPPSPPKHIQKLQTSFPVPHARPLRRPLPTGPAPTPTAHSGTLLFSNSIEEQLLGTTAAGPTASTAEDQEFNGSEHNPHQKVSMIDRVSTFYANYKLLAWGGIVLFVSIGMLAAIAALYMNNPPTEVVTAKRDLVTRLSDPSVMKFLQNLMEGDGHGRKTSKDHEGARQISSMKVKDTNTTDKDASTKSNSADSRIRTRRKRSKSS